MVRKLVAGIEGLGALDHASGPVAGWVQRATRRTVVDNGLSGTWLGHKLHPVLADLPIGGWAMAFTVDLTAGRSGAPAARRLI